MFSPEVLGMLAAVLVLIGVRIFRPETFRKEIKDDNRLLWGAIIVVLILLLLISYFIDPLLTNL